jgi:cyclopropane fatty-acyl-phospholipid synthase-like methyltransferase
MQAGRLLVDTGCGDGRVLRQVFTRYGVRAVGYELNLLAYVKVKLLELLTLQAMR